MWVLILLISAAILARECSGDCHASPSWQSEWMTLRSQAGAASFLELNHGLGQLPYKAKALVRPLSGANAGLSFEAIGSAQWDDDVNVQYCGVAFVYNEMHVRLGAPTRYNNFRNGRIFCAGQSGWSDSNGRGQKEEIAEVKVVLWLKDSFPTPDVLIDWKPLDCTGYKQSSATCNLQLDPAKAYYEIANPAGQALDFLTIQVRVQDTSGRTWIADGIGTDNAPVTYTNIGGVIYSHSDTTIRLWIRNVAPGSSVNRNSVVNIADGWGFRQHTPAAYIRAGVGDVRIIGWKSLGTPLFRGSNDIYLDGTEDLVSEVSLSGIVWDPIGSIVSLQIIPLDGANEGSVFYGNGVMPRVAISGKPVGGVQFGYSQCGVRFFYPVGVGNCMVRIGPTMGNGEKQQCSRRARIKLTIWEIDTCEKGTRGTLENMPPKKQKAALALEQDTAALVAQIVSETFEAFKHDLIDSVNNTLSERLNKLEKYVETLTTLKEA